MTEASMIEGKHFKNAESRRLPSRQPLTNASGEVPQKKRSGGGMHKTALKRKEAIGPHRLSQTSLRR